MGFLDIILGLFGGKKSVNFGNVNPDDIESYWLVDHELDQAERESPQAHQACLAKWGLKSMDHWDQVKGELYQRHGQNPDFNMAAARVQQRVQNANMAQSYQMPAEYSAPVHGVDLIGYATVKARLELGQNPGQVLAEHRLDPGRWNEVDQAWSWRMGPQGDAFAGNILRGNYHVAYLQAQAAYRGR